MLEKPLVTIPLPKAQVKLEGYSRSGVETCFHVPEMKWLLDAGAKYEGIKPNKLFLTHNHADHSFMIPFYYHREKTVQIYCPAETAPTLENWMLVCQQVNDCVPELSQVRPPRYELVPVKSGDSFIIENGSYKVDVLTCCHSVPCVAYGFSRAKKKLRGEYAHLSGTEIGKLRKSGVEVSETLWEPMFVFCGDTNEDIFAQDEAALEKLFSYPYVVIECTLLDSSLSREDVKSRGHMSWAGLEPVIVARKSTHFIITHFSPRHNDDFIRSFFAEKALPNVTPCVQL